MQYFISLVDVQSLVSAVLLKIGPNHCFICLGYYCTLCTNQSHTHILCIDDNCGWDYRDIPPAICHSLNLQYSIYHLLCEVLVPIPMDES